jgi:hypothetical protein
MANVNSTSTQDHQKAFNRNLLRRNSWECFPALLVFAVVFSLLFHLHGSWYFYASKFVSFRCSNSVSVQRFQCTCLSGPQNIPHAGTTLLSPYVFSTFSFHLFLGHELFLVRIMFCLTLDCKLPMTIIFLLFLNLWVNNSSCYCYYLCSVNLSL